MLRVRDLAVDLGRRPVLRGVDLEVRPAELVALTGPNGAGKSTLLRALCGLAPAARGVVAWEGEPVAAMRPAARARVFAFMPQGREVNQPVQVRRLVELGRLPRLGPLSRPAAADGEAVERAMAAADVLHLADRVSTDLSGGERARVLLARALAVEAPVLLADEPTAGLDPRHALEVMAVFRRLADAGAAVVVSTHDLPLAAEGCDRAVLLAGGRVVADAPPDEALGPERLRDVYGVDPRGPLRAPYALTPGPVARGLSRRPQAPLPPSAAAGRRRPGGPSSGWR